jgi:hypothetical protein
MKLADIISRQSPKYTRKAKLDHLIRLHFQSCDDEAKEWLFKNRKGGKRNIFYNQIDWIQNALCIQYGDIQVEKMLIPYDFFHEKIEIKKFEEEIYKLTFQKVYNLLKTEI